MRIAFIGARGIPHGYSSSEQIALHVGKRLVRRGHEFTVYCRRNLFADRTPVYEGINRVFLPTIEHKLFGQVIHGLLAGIHAAGQPYDVVHAQCLTNTFQSVVPWLIRRNVVINVNGQEWDNPKWPRTLRHLFFKSAVIAYGAELVESLDPTILGRYGLEPHGYYLVAARLVPRNQIRTIVDAFNAAGASRLLAIAGAGDPRSPYYQAVRAAAGPNVRFLGLISDQTHMD